MLKQEQVTKIEKLLKLPKGALSEAISSDTETEVEIPELTILDETGLNKLKSSSYNDGKKAGVEMAVKEYADEAGIEVAQKDRNIKSFAEIVKAAALEEAGAKPDERIAKKDKDIENLRKEYKKLQDEKTEIERKIVKAESKAALYQSVPSLGEGQIPVDKLVRLMEADGYQFTTENGKLSIKDPSGNDIRTNTLEDIAPKDILTGYAKEIGLYREQTEPDPIKGRGGGNPNPAPVFTKQSEVKAHYEKQGKSVNGEEYLNHIRQLRTENPDFKVNE